MENKDFKLILGQIEAILDDDTKSGPGRLEHVKRVVDFTIARLNTEEVREFDKKTIGDVLLKPKSDQPKRKEDLERLIMNTQYRLGEELSKGYGTRDGSLILTLGDLLVKLYSVGGM